MGMSSIDANARLSIVGTKKIAVTPCSFKNCATNWPPEIFANAVSFGKIREIMGNAIAPAQYRILAWTQNSYSLGLQTRGLFGNRLARNFSNEVVPAVRLE